MGTKMEKGRHHATITTIIPFSISTGRNICVISSVSFLFLSHNICVLFTCLILIKSGFFKILPWHYYYVVLHISSSFISCIISLLSGYLVRSPDISCGHLIYHCHVTERQTPPEPYIARPNNPTYARCVSIEEERCKPLGKR